MTDWLELYGEHQRLRSSGRASVSEIRSALRELSELRPSVLRANLQSRLQVRKNRAARCKVYGFEDAEGEPIRFDELDVRERDRVGLRSARLVVLATVDDRRDRLVQLTLMLEGETVACEPWAIAVHLEDDGDAERGDRRGLGAAGHAALHFHSGPTLDARPNVRVPLPAVSPAALLRWLVSQVVPVESFEPAPWGAVMAKRDQQA